MKWTLARTFASLSLMIALLAPVAHATTITPDSIDIVTPDWVNTGADIFGPPKHLFTDEYKGLGLMFGPDKVAAILDTEAIEVYAWAGVSTTTGEIDLRSPITGYFVVPGTTTLAVTNTVEVEVGITATLGTLLLEVYDIDGNPIGQTLSSGLSDGPHNRTLISYASLTNDIHWFSVYWTPLGQTEDELWAMPQVSFGELTAAAVVSAPPTVVLLFVAGVVAVARRRRRR
jgi:hypothetical protein